MKHKKHLTYFIVDHLWVILVFLLAPIGFFFIYSILSNCTLSDFGYYLFLEVFILVVTLLWRLYVTWDIYEQFCNESGNMDDYVIVNPKCHQALHYQQVLKHLRTINKTISNASLTQRKNQKFMIYQWVHQMKTPLSVIKLLAENHKAHTDFYKILLSVDQMEYSLNQILTLYQLDAIENEFKAEKVLLSSLCKKTINQLKAYFISHEVYPKLDIPNDLYVYSDSRWLQLVIYQLLTNAIKYSPPNKTVLLKVEIIDKQAILYVKDEGCGIPKADLDRIFDLFFVGENGRKNGESSGIGLYIVQRITKYLNHTLQVESIEGKGTIFTIIFDMNN